MNAMSVDTKELRRLAEAATPGPWDVGDAWTHDDAAYINAANPQVILVMLDEVDALREVVRCADAEHNALGVYDTAPYENARAKVRLP